MFMNILVGIMAAIAILAGVWGFWVTRNAGTDSPAFSSIYMIYMNLSVFSPDFLSHFFYKLQLCPLLLLCQFVADLAGCKSALWA